MRQTIGELVRYGVVGLTTNAVLYGAYLLLTAWGVSPKVAMTCLYAVGVTVSFFVNRRVTFADEGSVRGAVAR